MIPSARSNIKMRNLRTHSKSCRLFSMMTLLIYFVLEGGASSAPTGTSHNIDDSLLISATSDKLGHLRSRGITLDIPDQRPVLGETDRHQRQIQFKESYKDLPHGIPETSEEVGDPDEPLAYFALKVTLERPVVDVGYRDRSRNTLTYFPPDAVPEDFLYSSREEDLLSFLTFTSNTGTEVDETDNKKNYVEYSPFYIPPSKGVDYRPESAIETTTTTTSTTTTETPIFLVSNIDTTTSQTTHIFYSVTPQFQDFSSSTTKQNSESSFEFSPSEPVNNTVPPLDIITTQIDTNIHVKSPPFITTLNSTNSEVQVSPSLKYTKETTKEFFAINDNENENKAHTVHKPTNLFTSKSKSLQNFVRPTSNLPSHSNPDTPENNNSHNLNSDPQRTLKTTESSQISSDTRHRSPPTIFETIRPSGQLHQQKHSDIQPSSSFHHRSYPEGEKDDSRVKQKAKKHDIPGIRGRDYPVYETTPYTSFDCSSKEFGGYYADAESRCQVFHVCMGKLNVSFLCPIGTMFNQKLLVCDWWYNVKCPPEDSDAVHQENAFLDQHRRPYNPS